MTTRERPRRKREQSFSMSAAPFTVREALFVRLVIESANLLDISVKYKPNHPMRARQAGYVDGMALMLAKMFGNGYQPYWDREVEQVLGKASTLAEKWIKKGRPEKDKWWKKQHDAGLFWRSSIDKG